jgi:endonuclease YncB( thermonuclease family)
MSRRVLSLAALLIALAAPVNAESVSGRASVIDGDTIEIHGQRIRLHGIDAPESGQTCRDGTGRDYRCGQRAALALADKIGQRTISCDRRDVDQYGRIVAVCRSAGEDLNGWLVSEGWAVAYHRFSMDYVRNEAAAKAAKRGIWAGNFTTPEEWRHGQQAQAGREQRPKPQEPATCVIKGNISSRGERIYHMPGGQFYDRTRIDPSKGERMFCSEDEARAAGWRRSKR